jgi:hypothetical protein
MNMIKSREINDANTKIAIMEYTLKMKGVLWWIKNMVM